jgi:hypothetical protein
MVGIPLGLAMGGFAICAVTLTVGLIGGAAFIGAVFGGAVSALWRRAWWAGALSFSLAMCPGLVFATTGTRIVAIVLCALAAFLVAFVVRYPGPQSLRS